LTNPIGHKRWAIAEGYIPTFSHGPEPEMTSHETACLLNASDQDAHVQITIFFSDREPVGPYRVTVPAKRTKHMRFNELKDPEPIPLGTDYASVIEIRCSNRRATHSLGFSPGCQRAAHDHRIRGGRMTSDRDITREWFARPYGRRVVTRR
jgi:hypothetical protein